MNPTLNYIGGTSRSLKTRKAEHISITNVEQHENGYSNIAKHAWDNNHVID